MFKKFIVYVILFSFAACGGGGGGGGDISGSAPTGIRILHGAIDSSPVDLYSNLVENAKITTAQFAEATFFASLPSDRNNLKLTRYNIPSEVIANEQLIVENDNHYSLIFYGNQLGFGLKTNIINDDAGEIPSGTAAVKIIHALVGASELQAGFSNSAVSDNAVFGSATSYSYVPAGIVGVVVKRVTDGKIVANISQQFDAGKAYSVFMAGQIDYFVTSRVLAD